MISTRLMRSLQTFDDNSIKAKSLLKLCKEINISNFKNICIVGYNSEINPPRKTKITIIEPTYYEIFNNVNNLTYINKFCWKDNKTHFDLSVSEDPDANFGIKAEGEPNTITIDQVGNFDLIIDLAINSYYEVLLGANQNIIKNHPVILHSLFSTKYEKIQEYLFANGYSDCYFAKHNDNILVCYE